MIVFICIFIRFINALLIDYEDTKYIMNCILGLNYIILGLIINKYKDKCVFYIIIKKYIAFYQIVFRRKSLMVLKVTFHGDIL